MMPTLRECIFLIRKITFTDFLSVIALFAVTCAVASLSVLQ